MNYQVSLDLNCKEDNKSINEEILRGKPYFITLNRNIQIKIPCSNKDVADKILNSLNKNLPGKR